MADLATRIARHAEDLERGGRSPLYVALMRGAAASAATGSGPVVEVFDGDPGPSGSVPGLRLMAALHQLVLAGRAPELARYFPSAGGGERPEGAWAVAEDLIAAHRAEIRSLVARPVQTNEPGRSTVLYGALVWLAARHGPAVELLEIGASAGLNLMVDRFRYHVTGRDLGDPDSRLAFVEPWVGLPVADPWACRPRITARRACDRNPIDPTTAEGALRLLSYIWPDELDRLARLRAAIEIARRSPPPVDAAIASQWIAARLRHRRPGRLTVVWQSIVRQYLDDGERAAIERAIAQAGECATPDTPLAWATMEQRDDHLSPWVLTLRLWPDAGTTVLATTGPHGPPVRWG